jgi:hypothetical protein
MGFTNKNNDQIDNDKELIIKASQLPTNPKIGDTIHILNDGGALYKHYLVVGSHAKIVNIRKNSEFSWECEGKNAQNGSEGEMIKQNLHKNSFEVVHRPYDEVTTTEPAKITPQVGDNCKVTGNGKPTHKFRINDIVQIITHPINKSKSYWCKKDDNHQYINKNHLEVVSRPFSYSMGFATTTSSDTTGRW